MRTCVTPKAEGLIAFRSDLCLGMEPTGPSIDAATPTDSTVRLLTPSATLALHGDHRRLEREERTGRDRPLLGSSGRLLDAREQSATAELDEVQRLRRQEGLHVPVRRHERRRIGVSTMQADRLEADYLANVWVFEHHYDVTQLREDHQDLARHRRAHPRVAL